MVLGKLVAWYKTTAITAANALILLILINLASFFLLRIDGEQSSVNQHTRAWLIEKYGFDRLARAYSGWDQKDLQTLLRETSNWVDEYEPFTQFRPIPRRDKFITITQHGYRPVEDQGAWPPPRDITAVFFFGGSTTMGAGLPDGDTIPAHFQRLAANCTEPIRVYNFGRGYYFSTQERILFHQLLLDDHVPRLAIFIDGLNDFYFAAGEPQWTSALRRYMSQAQTEAMPRTIGVWPASKALFRNLPVTRYITTKVSSQPEIPTSSKLDRALPLASVPEIPFEAKFEESAKAVIRRWQGNRRLIEASSRKLGIKVAFVFQPVPTYSYDLRFLNVYDGDPTLFADHKRSATGYRLMAELVSKNVWGKNFLWLGEIQRARKENLYVDAIHYNSRFSGEIAREIFRFTTDNQLLNCGR